MTTASVSASDVQWYSLNAGTLGFLLLHLSSRSAVTQSRKCQLAKLILRNCQYLVYHLLYSFCEVNRIVKMKGTSVDNARYTASDFTLVTVTSEK